MLQVLKSRELSFFNQAKLIFQLEIKSLLFKVEYYVVLAITAMLCDRAQYPSPDISRSQIALDTLRARTISLCLWRSAKSISLPPEFQEVSI